jgi:hypothetical protein
LEARKLDREKFGSPENILRCLMGVNFDKRISSKLPQKYKFIKISKELFKTYSSGKPA